MLVNFIFFPGTMSHRPSHRKHITIVLLITLQVAATISAKTKARPVIEIVNEQSRIDEKIRPPGPGLPYGNPLAGNSKQNARLHAQNQQAMFNAERVRQHRAQLQRWTKAPPQVDSYMRAYQESQENHQIAIEQQQANLRDIRQANPVTNPTPAKSVHSPRPEKKSSNVLRSPEPTKITKADAVVKNEKSRNHRSYGSVEYQQYLKPKRYQTVYVSPAPTYDQGVTIKPNGNLGLAEYSQPEEPVLYTAAGPSSMQYVYPKQYSQMQSYQSAQDIDTLNSLLKKNSNDQLSELSALLKSGKHKSKSNKDSLETPIDLFFYVKDSQSPGLPQHYDQSKYAQIGNYASAYRPEHPEDHKPITEDVDDIEDPNKDVRLKTYGLQSFLATEAPEMETTTTKSNNYYKVEVASQTISAPYNPSSHKLPHYYKSQEDDKPKYQLLQYAQHPPEYYVKKYPKTEDLSERYLHHNAQHTGVQHLTGDGTGVSAYGDDDVSITKIDSKAANTSHSRNVRSILETDPFITSNISSNLTNNDTSTNETAPIAEPWSRANPISNKRFEISPYLMAPTFPVGEANDYEFDDPPIYNRRKPYRQSYDDYEDSDEEEEFDEDDEYESDYVRPFKNFQVNSASNPFLSYAPLVSYNQNVDLKGSYSKKHRKFNQQSDNFDSFQDYQVQDSYAPPVYGQSHQSFAEPAVYEPPKQNLPMSYGAPVQNPHNVVEPVYMLTQSQLKSLIGDSNVNIQHFDVFQLPTHKKPAHRPKKHKKRYPPRNRYSKFRQNVVKLRKLRIL